MTQDEIIRMAREAELYSYLWGGDINQQSLETLERFAALVVAHEREKQAENDDWKKASYIRELLNAEREACAKVCDELVKTDGFHQAEYCAAAIRARGEK